MRNPVYCGKLFVLRHLEEEAMIVQGQHQPIISEDIYNEVQDVLDGRKVHNRGHIMSPEQLPFRGFLLCPTCGKTSLEVHQKENIKAISITTRSILVGSGSSPQRLIGCSKTGSHLLNRLTVC